jgi:hypothetical protein
MQATPAPIHRLHWIPVAPSWLVAGGIVLLASMPHKVPVSFRSLAATPLGTTALLGLSAWIWTLKPVLGIALVLLTASLYIRSRTEGFMAAPVLIKDRVRKDGAKWLSEDIMSEDPHTIQERTEEPNLLVDEVSDEEARPWFVEDTLGESSEAIQERPVASYLPGDRDVD